MNKEIKKIFILLIFCSLSDGFYYNFQQLWMQSNDLSIKTIGTVLSIAALLSVSVIFLCSNLITQNKIKNFLKFLLSTKIIVILALFFLNSTGINILIKFLIMLDYVIDVEIYACIYPLITVVEKDNKKYALKTIIYEGFYYIAVIVSTIILGKTFGIMNINYNTYLIFSLIFLIIGLLILFNINVEQYYDKEENNLTDLNIMKKLFKIVSQNKSVKQYLGFQFANNISYSCLTGLMLIILMETLKYNSSTSSYIIMLMGISSSILGYVSLKFLTFKNDYINISIKFALRLFFYLLAFITGSKIMILIALIYTKISSASYAHIASAPYVNMIDSKYQLAFCNLSEMLAYLGKAIGTFISGITLAVTIKYNFIVASIFTGIGLYFAYKAIYIRTKRL